MKTDTTPTDLEAMALERAAEIAVRCVAPLSFDIKTCREIIAPALIAAYERGRKEATDVHKPDTKTAPEQEDPEVGPTLAEYLEVSRYEHELGPDWEWVWTGWARSVRNAIKKLAL
jgi:hypothetical protein